MWKARALHLFRTTGKSGRQIAEELGIGKTTVNEFLAKYRRNDGEPKILFYDLETSQYLVKTWSLKTRYINPDRIQREPVILCWSAKWLGSDEVMNDHTLQYGDALDDFEVTQNLIRLFNEADIVIAHNGDNFDLKMLNWRRKINGLKKWSHVDRVDTLKISRKEYRAPSHKLDYLGELLVGDKKVKHEGISLWDRCEAGDPDAFKDMLTYCDQDVRILEQVYLGIRPDATTHPNMSLYGGEEDIVCPRCRSENMERTERFAKTRSQQYRIWECMDCGHESRERRTALSPEKKETSLI